MKKTLTAVSGLCACGWASGCCVLYQPQGYCQAEELETERIQESSWLPSSLFSEPVRLSAALPCHREVWQWEALTTRQALPVNKGKEIISKPVKLMTKDIEVICKEVKDSIYQTYFNQ